jgi:hypothetical protein
MAAVVNVGLASNADIYRASWNVLGYGAQKRLLGGITRALYSYGRKPAANAGAAAIEANQPAFSLTAAGAAAVVPRVWVAIDGDASGSLLPRRRPDAEFHPGGGRM